MVVVISIRNLGHLNTDGSGRGGEQMVQESLLCNSSREGIFFSEIKFVTMSNLAAITSFAVCFCCLLGFGLDGVRAAAVTLVFMDASSLAVALAFALKSGRWSVHTCRTPPGEGGGVATAGRGGSPTLATERSGSGKGGAERRAAQAKRGSLGKLLAGARGGAP